MSSSLSIARVAAILAAAGAAAAIAAGGAQPTKLSWRVPPGDAARGATLAQGCLACHGDDAPAAAGLDPPPPKLMHQRASYLYFALAAYRDGSRKSEVMQPMAEALSDQDMRDLAVHFSRGMLDRPPKARTDLPGYRITSRECTWCHGETGIGELEGMPVLTGQDPKYLAAALAEYRSGTRTDPTMRAEVAHIAPADDAALVEYYAAHAWLEHGK